MNLWDDYDGIGAFKDTALDHGILLAGVSFQVGGVVLFMGHSTIPSAIGPSWPIEIRVIHTITTVVHPTIDKSHISSSTGNKSRLVFSTFPIDASE